MNITIECPSCKQQYSVDASVVGEEVECAACNKVFVAKKKPIKLELPKEVIEKDSINSAKGSSTSEQITPSTPKKIRYHRNALSYLFDSLDEEKIKEEKDKKSNGTSWVFSIVFLVIIIVYIAFAQAFVKILARSIYGYLIVGAIILLYFVIEIWKSNIAKRRENQDKSSLSLTINSTTHPFAPDSSHKENNISFNKEIDNNPKNQSIGNPLSGYDTPSRRISTLIEQQDWNSALKYCKELLESDPSPGRQAQLWQIKVKASDFYLQRCMKKHSIKDISEFYLCHTSLLNDDDFVQAINCAVPEQVDILKSILRKQEKRLRI